MRRTFQAAAVLCYHRSATAFVSPSAALPSRTSALRRSSTSHSSWVLPQQQVLNEQREQRHAATALRAGLDGDGSDAEAAMKKLLQEDFGANVAVDPKRVAVLFDFDGTIGDTETPAMEVAYWELAPYFPGAATGGELVDMSEYVRNNAGKAFEFMLEVVEADRKEQGLPDIATARAESAENPEIMKVVDAERAKYGLKPLGDLRAAGTLKDILTQQKEETVDALSVVARPVEGMVNALDELRARKLPFAIATTSPKPRVPASIHACGLDDYFPADKVHSGESDFDPPRFKPDPSVYLKAAQFEGALPPLCVAVEDSASGVGSAYAAEMGLIVGYVGASHISASRKSEHAKMLRHRGARVVVDEMKDLITLVDCFAECMAKGEDFCLPIANVINTLDPKRVWG
uniref:Mannitol-1-phosphatase n=1 Tax=Saccharina japonica TaxID=88149 RepID=A0A068B0R3_SACJA|nr:mannitol-1-phosphatase [Saccharina japonica]AWO65272.1 mannitol-1-phosphatase 1 [Saccharina japonica]